MKQILFYPEAEKEMIEAAKWYESQQPDLGKRFLSSIQSSLSQITLKPNLFALIYKDIHRCITKTFPFGILYRIKKGNIEIIAVMHLHRKPGYWKNRNS